MTPVIAKETQKSTGVFLLVEKHWCFTTCPSRIIKIATKVNIAIRLAQWTSLTSENSRFIICALCETFRSVASPERETAMYRPIRRDMGEGITPSIDFGPVTQMRWIEIDQLCVDDSYQREIGKRGRNNIKRIAENFEWFKFAPVIVAPLVDDRYAIVDGQHRTTAAAICGIATVPCQIIIADQAKQAEAFAAVNGSITKTTPHQVFHARVAARDPLIAEIEKACQVASVFITRTQKGAAHYKVGETAAIGAITKAYLRYGRETLITGLMCITQTGDGNVGYIRSTIVEAMCAALAHRRDWRDAGDALLRAMDEFIFAEEWDRASEGRTNIIKSKAVSKIFYDRIVEHLSTRLKTSIQASCRDPKHDAIVSFAA